MKILVCLVSDQHVPNLLTVHAVEPDLLFLVETPGMKVKRGAPNFIRALRMGNSKKPKCKIKILKEENSIEATNELLGNLFLMYPDADWIVNITGGTKPMSIGAFEFFRNKTAKILYVPIAGQSKAINFSDGTFDDLKYKLGIKEFLAGYGFELIKGELEVRENETLALKWFETSRYLAANYSEDAVFHFLRHFADISNKRKGREKGLCIQDLDEIELKDEILIKNLIQIFPSISVKDDMIMGCLEANEVEFLTGGWLEVFIWVMLYNHSDDLGIRDVHLNLEIGSKSSIEPKPKNEWDVTFMQGQSLCLIECKTGTQKKKKGEDILYKVEAIKKHLGALRVNSYLATTSPNVIDKETGKIYEHLKTRSALYNCKIIEGSEIRIIAELQHDPWKANSEIVKQIAKTFNLGKVAQI